MEKLGWIVPFQAQCRNNVFRLLQASTEVILCLIKSLLNAVVVYPGNCPDAVI